MQKWLSAARLRTLPLALSCIILGNSLALNAGEFSYLIFILSILTTVTLQVLSNFANDYGDFQNGADLTGRIGPVRAVQSGEISQQSMLNAIILFVILSLIVGISLLFVAFEGNFNAKFFFFLLLGIASIIAAYKYTAGKNPYGYAGLGDVSVFLFFGLVGVLGSCFLQTKTFNFINLFPAITCGLMATGVLNINNIRDIESDSKAGKKTIPMRLGKQKAIYYHAFLLIIAFVSYCFYVYFSPNVKNAYLVIPLVLGLNFNFMKVKSLPNPDPMLKNLALTTFVFSLLFFILNSF
jgi:1,4-dihydroxy-2-naphthoate polyprenyltransferase